MLQIQRETDTNTSRNRDTKPDLKKRKGDTVVGGVGVAASGQSVGLSPVAGARLQSHPQSEVDKKFRGAKFLGGRRT